MHDMHLNRTFSTRKHNSIINIQDMCKLVLIRSCSSLGVWISLPVVALIVDYVGLEK